MSWTTKQGTEYVLECAAKMEKLATNAASKLRSQDAVHLLVGQLLSRIDIQMGLVNCYCAQATRANDMYVFFPFGQPALRLIAELTADVVALVDSVDPKNPQLAIVEDGQVVWVSGHYRKFEVHQIFVKAGLWDACVSRPVLPEADAAAAG